jgi:hypothetical protein
LPFYQAVTICARSRTITLRQIIMQRAVSAGGRLRRSNQLPKGSRNFSYVRRLNLEGNTTPKICFDFRGDDLYD